MEFWAVGGLEPPSTPPLDPPLLEMFFGDLHSSYVTYYLNVLG